MENLAIHLVKKLSGTTKTSIIGLLDLLVILGPMILEILSWEPEMNFQDWLIVEISGQMRMAMKSMILVFNAHNENYTTFS